MKSVRSNPFVKYPLGVLVALTIAVFTLSLHFGDLGTRSDAALGDAALLLAVMAFLGLIGVPNQLRKERLRRSGIAVIDTMDGVEFEQRLAHLYAFFGYKVSDTAVTGDFGADLVMDKDGERTVVQAKRYEGNVGIEAVQQVIGAKAHYGATAAIVVTNSMFTPAALTLAQSNGVLMVDRSQLIDMLATQMRDQSRPLGLSLMFRQIGAGVMPALTFVYRVVSLVVKILVGIFKTLAKA
jgi:restriction system protein